MFFPAYAGVFLSNMVFWGFGVAFPRVCGGVSEFRGDIAINTFFPRVCGGVSNKPSVIIDSQAFSPRMRGRHPPLV